MKLATSAARSALENPDTLATVLHAILYTTYGESWYVWDPSTISLELKDDYGVELKSEVLDRICAVQLVMISNGFFQDIETFTTVCSTLPDGDPLFNVFDPPSVEELAWTVSEVAMNRELLPFSREIKQFVLHSLPEYGYTDLTCPTPLKELLEAVPDAPDIVAAAQGVLAAELNLETNDSFMRETLLLLKEQLDAIPELQGTFEDIIQLSLIPALDKRITK